MRTAHREASSTLACMVLSALLASLAFGVNASPAGAVREVVLAAGIWGPYVSKDDPDHGLSAEIVEAALREVGYEPRFSYVTRATAEHLVRGGKVAAAFPFLPVAGGEKAVEYSDGFFAARAVLFYRKDRLPWFDFGSLSSLKGLRVCVTLGSGFEKIFVDQGIHVLFTGDTASAMRLLREGRADLVVESMLAGCEAIRVNWPDEYSQFGSSYAAFVEAPQRLMIDRSNPGADEFLRDFNRGLAAIRKNGAYQRILARFDSKIEAPAPSAPDPGKAGAQKAKARAK